MNNTQVLGHMAVALLQLSCCQLAGLTAGQAGRRLEAGRLGRQPVRRWPVRRRPVRRRPVRRRPLRRRQPICKVALLQLSCCQLAGRLGGQPRWGWVVGRHCDPKWIIHFRNSAIVAAISYSTDSKMLHIHYSTCLPFLKDINQFTVLWSKNRNNYRHFSSK